MTRRVRIAILGGGCAGIAAAERLTRHPMDRERFEVTVYQRGHRLGGKGATGRNSRHGWRIEEHGLHVWLGFYRRAFAMMKTVYAEWNAPAQAPIRTIEQAFAPGYEAWLPDSGDCPREAMRLRLPPTPGRPWDDPAATEANLNAALARLQGVLDLLVDLARAGGAAPRTAARRIRATASLVRATLRGLALDVLPRGAAGFEHIDAWDLRQWLRHHKASPAAVSSPLVLAFYNLAFAYPEGRREPDRGRVAAGTALKAIIRLLAGYRGAPFWRMRAGMGDTIFAPAYQVLRQRGVAFEFFTDVQALRLDASGERIERIEIRRQARPRRTYEPLIAVRGQPCWPSRPRYDQLIEGEELAASGVDLECGPSTGERQTLALGRDFDRVVLAIPVPVHRRIAAELIEASPRYAAMVRTSASVATIAAQLWLRARPAELGWGEGAPISSGGCGLFSTWADMTDTLAHEDWPADDAPRAVAYLCDVAAEEASTEHPDRHAAAAALAGELAAFTREHLREAWSLVADRDPAKLLCHGPLAEGESAYSAQYLRVNVDPSERYVLSLPGTTRHRLAPEDSGFRNLLLAGDWTRTSVNGGSVEAAVESGQRAAEAALKAAHEAADRSSVRRTERHRPAAE